MMVPQHKILALTIFFPLKPLDLSIEALIEIIKTEEIKIVSFDIFEHSFNTSNNK